MDRQVGAFMVRARRAFAFAILGALALALVPGGADAQVLFSQADFSGYATGTVVHTDALQSGATRVENTDQAMSGASVNSKGLTTQITNEMQRVVQPAQAAGKFTFGRGVGFELGLVQAPSAQGQLVLPTAPPADAVALPSTDLITREVLGRGLSNLAYASVIRSQTQARWSTAGDCVLGSDLSRGLGYIADAQLVGANANPDGSLVNALLGTDAPNPERAVSQSTSRNVLVRQLNRTGQPIGSNFGLMSEVRMTIAPVTLFRGATNQLTIEFLGEWVLQAVAGGIANGAFIHYGPGAVSPQTPVLRTINAAGDVSNVLTLQQLLTNTGRQIVVPGVAEIAIGEPPRGINGAYQSAVTEAATGTEASAAVDVARVKVLEQRNPAGEVTTRAADVRVGHMEVRAIVPPGGISCQVPVTKVANPASVFVGTPFTTTITVSNPFDCDLTSVRLVDDVRTEQAARFKVQGSDPAANTATPGENLATAQIVWNDIGTIPPGGTKAVNVTFLPQGGAGLIIDKATATGTLANCRGAGGSVAGVGTAVAGAGLTGVSGELKVGVGEVKGEQLARTGSRPHMAFFAGLALLMLAGMGRIAAKRIV